MSRRFSGLWLVAFLLGATANADENPIDRNMRPLTIQLPVFYLERMVQEQISFTHESWINSGARATITTQLCRPLTEVLQPWQAPLRSVLIRKDIGSNYEGTLTQRFSINQTCGSSIEFELNLAVNWLPQERRVEVRVAGRDQHQNISGSADWEFEIESDNPASIDLVIPENSFQSGLLGDSDIQESNGSCAGMRVTSFAERIGLNQ